MADLIKLIRDSVIGSEHGIKTSFGLKPLVYADYTASGRSLSFIEDYIRDRVLPFYANTHTETSFTGAQTTALREQARQEVRKAVNAGVEDKVIFAGSGATSAIHKLLDILNLRLPYDLAKRYQLQQYIPAQERPVVFIGPYEHHSNELPWRESIADVITIPLTAAGQIDLDYLQQQLQLFSHRPLLIGSFSAASNVTGLKSDVGRVTAMLKAQGALAFWDYAAAGPYIEINMNGEHPLDAVFLSPHKFVGGPGTPGILIVKKHLVNNTVPAMVGGGTVKYVTPEDHLFTDDIERREEGGTPAIVETVRAGLVFKLQQEVGVSRIEQLEHNFASAALARFSPNPKLQIMGDQDRPGLSIMSLRFKHGSKDLHYGFVVSLLNDLFGIQVRGGCSCAGPYGHSLLAMDMEYSRAIELEIAAGNMIMRPGWVRLNFNYFIDEQEFEYLLRAIELVAEHGWRMLPFYHYDSVAGVWCYQGRRMCLPEDLSAFTFSDLPVFPSERRTARMSFASQIELAHTELLRDDRAGPRSAVKLNDRCESLRWFVLPQDVAIDLPETKTPD
ncbi:UNVERIFIED_CONTAM: hypothetical protein GTU68_047484 [Idotea baltica]|nr:hypothetical protein [Idotea baltica]